MAAESSETSLPAQAAQLWDLVRAYAKQETIGSLKGLPKYAGFGIGGSLLLSIGLVELALAGLRALQTETGDTFAGQWSWAPYLIVVFVTAIVLVLALRGTRKRKT